MANEELNEVVEIHDQLNPKIWTEDKELIPEVRAKILQIVNKFKNLVALDGVDLKIEDIYVLGSNANYNYNEDSDLDIHIIADESFDCSEEHLGIIYNCYKSLFNNKYDITIKGIDVELYVENKENLTNVSAGVYSLNNGWIKDPAKYEIPEIDQNAIDRGVKTWEDKYFDVTLDPSITKIDKYLDSIYELRNDSIKKDGEFGEGNLVFKEIRRLGYLDDLRELKIELTSQELSLESLEEEVNEQFKKSRYDYEGPLYVNGNKYVDLWKDTTYASSTAQALNILRYKAREKLGLWGVDLVPECLTCTEVQYIEKPKEIIKQKVCPNCGTTLNDIGECPLCDLGDYSVLE